MTDCRHIRENVSAYIDAELDADARRQLHEHVAQCEDCRRLLEEMSRTAGLVRDLPGLSAPAELADGVASQVQEAIAQDERRRLLRRRVLRVARIGSMAAGLLLAAVAGWVAVDRFLEPRIPDGSVVDTSRQSTGGDRQLAANKKSAENDTSGARETKDRSDELAMGLGDATDDETASITFRGAGGGGKTNRNEPKPPRDAADGDMAIALARQQSGQLEKALEAEEVLDSRVRIEEIDIEPDRRSMNVLATHRLTIRTRDPERTMAIVMNLFTALNRPQAGGPANEKAADSKKKDSSGSVFSLNGLESATVVLHPDQAREGLGKLRDIFGDDIRIAQADQLKEVRFKARAGRVGGTPKTGEATPAAPAEPALGRTLEGIPKEGPAGDDDGPQDTDTDDRDPPSAAPMRRAPAADHAPEEEPAALAKRDVRKMQAHRELQEARAAGADPTTGAKAEAHLDALTEADRPSVIVWRIRLVTPEEKKNSSSTDP